MEISEHDEIERNHKKTSNPPSEKVEATRLEPGPEQNGKRGEQAQKDLRAGAVEFGIGAVGIDEFRRHVRVNIDAAHPLTRTQRKRREMSIEREQFAAGDNDTILH